MITQTITFKDGTILPIIAVYGNKEVVQNAYRETFEIQIPIGTITYDELSALITSENLSELILTETDDETNEVTAQFTHSNFTIVIGLGFKTKLEDGSKYLFLSVAQKHDTELAIERLSQDNEDLQAAVMELAEIIAGETEE